MTDYVCIHGHFYQPPRENPWLEDVEMQDSAYPFHDWNEKITTECYLPNSSARVLGEKKLITDIVNNYSKMSYDFGPTLLSWLERHRPETYHQVLASDKMGQKLFSGHGPAIAQAYNHVIMPLASQRDKLTQVIWGIADFEHRFGRFPDGMWLPETAVDIATLEMLAANGIKYTILSPHQAKQTKKLGTGKWKSAADGLDIRMPYLCQLPSGKNISIFFYDGKTSYDVSYGNLLEDGETFAKRLAALLGDGDGPKLAHIATDGETYGHHHRYAEMALAYAARYIEERKLGKLTVYGEYLEKVPPQYEVQIIENTSWSCAHGIERWRNNCGCHAGRFPSGMQQWRKPLRDAIDRLSEEAAELYEKGMKKYVKDPWDLRNKYIEVVLDRSKEKVESFLAGNVNKGLQQAEKVFVLKMLEMQRNSMLMYTSCGWFFDDINGIETVQVMRYAGRTIQLARETGGPDLEGEFKKMLEQANSNLPDVKNGAESYETFVKRASVDLNRVGAHYAVSSIFEEYPEEAEIFCYTVSTENHERLEAGMQTMVIGRANLRSNIVLEEYEADFAAIYLGDQNIIAGVCKQMSDDAWKKVCADIKAAFLRGDSADVMRLMNTCFEGSSYTLRHLFKDERRKVLNKLLESTWEEIEDSFRRIYTRNYTIIQAMRGMNMPLPAALAAPTEFVLNKDIINEIQNVRPNFQKIERLLGEMRRLSLQPDKANLALEVGKRATELAVMIATDPENLKIVTYAERTARALNGLLDEADLQEAENRFFPMITWTYPRMCEKAKAGDKEAAKWVEAFRSMALLLRMYVPECLGSAQG
jgi:alpha-amylase/alpha-mannosidase (GH57 family)